MQLGLTFEFDRNSTFKATSSGGYFVRRPTLFIGIEGIFYLRMPVNYCIVPYDYRVDNYFSCPQCSFWEVRPTWFMYSRQTCKIER